MDERHWDIEVALAYSVLAAHHFVNGGCSRQSAGWWLRETMRRGSEVNSLVHAA